MVDPATASKVVILKKISSIVKHVDPSQLSISIGGLDPYVFDAATYFDNHLVTGDKSIVEIDTSMNLKGRPSILESLVKQEGYLEKLSSKGKWQRRYFILSDETLSYYDSKGSTQKGSISLSDSTSVLRDGNYISLQFKLGGDYRIRTVGGENAASWFENLQKNISLISGTGIETVSRSKGEIALGPSTTLREVDKASTFSKAFSYLRKPTKIIAGDTTRAASSSMSEEERKV